MNKMFVIMYEAHDQGSSSFVDDGIEVADARELISICPLKELYIRLLSLAYTHEYKIGIQ